MLTYWGRDISLMPASLLIPPPMSYISVLIFSEFRTFLAARASPLVSSPSVIITSLFLVSPSKDETACFMAASIFVLSFSVEELSRFAFTNSSVGDTAVTALPPKRDTAVLSPVSLWDWAEFINSATLSFCAETLSEISARNSVVSFFALSVTDIPERESMRDMTVSVLSAVDVFIYLSPFINFFVINTAAIIIMGMNINK